MSIVRAMAAHPKIMVLDEPTTALTDSEVDILMNFLENLGKAVCPVFTFLTNWKKFFVSVTVLPLFVMGKCDHQWRYQ